MQSTYCLIRNLVGDAVDNSGHKVSLCPMMVNNKYERMREEAVVTGFRNLASYI